MRHFVVRIVNTFAILLALFFLFNYFSPPPQDYVNLREDSLPFVGDPPAPHPIDRLGFVRSNPLGTSTQHLSTRRLDPQGQVIPHLPAATLLQPFVSSHCEIDGQTPSPNGQYLAIEYNCHADGFTQIFDLRRPNRDPVIITRSFFLDWSSDGAWYLIRKFDEDQIWLVASDNHIRHLLNFPDFTYTASFIPNSQLITFATSKGIGFGSELGTYNLSQNNNTLHQQFPNQIIASPRHNPATNQLAYILMPDSNIPFTIGELWLADESGSPTQLLDEVDAGHGHAPQWTPDGTRITYIIRENPHSFRANQHPLALRSNIAEFDLVTSSVAQLTQFEDSLVADIVWSPNGNQLAFVKDKTVWQMERGNTPTQVSEPNTIAQHPIWLRSTINP